MFNYTKDNWKRKGFLFGFWMFWFNAVFIFGTKQLAFTLNNLFLYFMLWITGGLIYGYFAYRWQSKK